MARHRNLTRAPISEAVIDIRTKPRPGIAPDSLATLMAQLGPGYGNPEPLAAMEFGAQPVSGRPASNGSATAGFRSVSTGGKHVVQFRTDGFAFSRLEPYTGWEEVIAEAARTWAVYEKGVALEEAIRIAVRYVNSLPLPADCIQDFSRYLTVPPPVPKNLNVTLGQFLTSVTVHEPESPICAHIVQAIQPTAAEETVQVILDVDVFEQGSFTPTAGAILPRFLPLRALKNRIFFNSLTEEAVALFE